MLKLLILLLVSPIAICSYAPQTLKEHIETADLVLHIQVVTGKAHQYDEELTDYKTKKVHLMHQTCGYSYEARVLETFKGSVKALSYIEFTAIESFSLGAEKLVFLSNSTAALATDTPTSYPPEHKSHLCKRDLPQLYSQHLSTSDFMDYNSWLSVNQFYQLSSEVFQSPNLVLKPYDNEEVKWNTAPSQDRAYGHFARWNEFRLHLLSIIEKYDLDSAQ